MPPKKNCSVPGCEDQDSVRHRFPILCNMIYDIWLKRISNPKLFGLTKEIVNRNYVICSKHFIDDCKNANSKRLKIYSLPSLHLPGFNEEGNETNSFAYPPVSIPIQPHHGQKHQVKGANNTGSTTSDIQDIPDTITNDTLNIVSELDTNVEDLEVDKLIDEPNSLGNISGESNLFGCPMCCEKQFSLTDLQQHISRYIWGSLKCPVCDEVCVGLEILAIHLDEHHSDQEMTLSENSLLTNVAKSTVSSEESVNISCGDVRDQVIKHQTKILTVDKSVNSGKNTGGTENVDMEIGVPLKNNNTSSLCTQSSGKNILDEKYRPRISVKNITSMHISSSSNDSLVKGSKLNNDLASNIGTKQKTSLLQSSDQTSFDIIKVYDHNYSQTSCAPVKHTLDAEQKLVTNLSETCENVSTSSTFNTQTHVGPLDGVDSNRDISCHKCGISFLSERTYVSHTKQFHSTSDCDRTQHHKTSPNASEKKTSPFGQRLSVIRPFKCQTCDKLFGYKDALHRHIQTHLK